MAHDALTYQLLKESRLCPRCKGQPMPGKICCAACLSCQSEHRAVPRIAAANTRRMKSRRAEDGVCAQCGGWPLVTDTLDAKCAEDLRTRSRARRNARRGGPPVRHYACGVCRQPGHDIRSCPKRAEVGMPTIEEVAMQRNDATMYLG